MRNAVIIRGDQARSLIDSEEFRARWSALCGRCPWATGYQSPAFAATWYQVYAGAAEPVLVVAESESGELVGLLTMAWSASDGELIFAGGSQCEYQTWISEAAEGDRFALSAVLALRCAFPDATIGFHYLPPGAPVKWVEDRAASKVALRCVCRRPIHRLDATRESSLNKSNNKKRLKALKKLGALEFRQITDPAELEGLIDELACYCDLRQLAMYGIRPFGDDPLKKPFHLAMMREENLLHVTMLRVGEQIGSVHLNLRGLEQVQLNLILHNPLLARHSPGKFHIHMLSEMLEEQGYKYLDLTPGGETYKDRFANSFDEARVVTVFPTVAARLRGALAASAERVARRLVRGLGIHPTRAKAAIAAVRHARARETASRSAGWLWSRRVMQHYVGRADGRLRASAATTGIRRDHLADLLRYAPRHGERSRQAFVHDALHRLEEGQHFYSRVEAGVLRVIGWMIERPSEAFVAKHLAGLHVSDEGGVLLRIDIFGGASPREPEVDCLSAMVADALDATGAVSIAIEEGRTDLIDAAQRIGLELAGGVVESRLFGRVSRRAIQGLSEIPRLARSSA